MIRNLRILTVVIACALLAAPAYALSITDPGVVGTIETGTQPSNVGNEREWANYLLSLATGFSITADGNTPLDGKTENYETTSTKSYSGTVFGGTQGNGTNVSGFTWVLAKYDGQNAGYVLFYVPDLGGTTIPEYSYSIWGSNSGQYQLSHFTAFNATSVPDGGATIALLGLSMLGLGYVRRRLA